MKFATVTFAVALAASGAAFAASPFIGSWKMDVAKSHLVGDTMTFTKTQKGYHEVKGVVSTDFSDDGTPYTSFNTATMAWTRTADGGWDIVFASNGKPVSKAHRTISADGKTLTTTYTSPGPNGSILHGTTVDTRVGGGTGLEGTWKSAKVDAPADDVVISAAGDAGFRVEYPTVGEVFTTRLDGSPSPLGGANIPAGQTASFRQVEPAKWSYANQADGKVVTQGVMAVSADGSTLTDTYWSPGSEDEKSVEVYARR